MPTMHAIKVADGEGTGVVGLKGPMIAINFHTRIIVVSGVFFALKWCHNMMAKQTRLPLVQAWKHGTGGRSGLHRAAQELTTLHREVRIRATETSLSS